MTRRDAILQFWFEGVTDQTPIKFEQSPFRKWFKKDQAFDAEIKEKFEHDLHQAVAGAYQGWEDSAKGRLAIILLIDQFARNMYRGLPQMYAYDALALNLAKDSIHAGMDKQLAHIERTFMYMPLMHSEQLEDQDLCVKAFEGLIAESEQTTPQNTHYFKNNLKYAIAHRDIIKKFNRFPHRNRILNRESTDEEKEFLLRPGSSF